MSDTKNIIAKVEIIKEMSSDTGVKQLAGVIIEYIKTTDKDTTMGFKGKK